MEKRSGLPAQSSRIKDELKKFVDSGGLRGFSDFQDFATLLDIIELRDRESEITAGKNLKNKIGAFVELERFLRVTENERVKIEKIKKYFREIKEIALKTPDAESFLRKICEMLSEEIENTAVSIRFERDEVKIVARSNSTLFERKIGDLFTVEERLFGEATENGKEIFIEDFESSEFASSFEEIPDFSFKSVVLIPFRAEDVSGGILVYSKKTLSEDDIWIFREVADYISLMLPVLSGGRLLLYHVFRKISEVLPAGVILVRNGRIRYANHRMRLMCGKSTDELENIPFTDIFHPEDREELLKAYKLVLFDREKSQVSVSARYADREGNFRSSSVSLLPLLEFGIVLIHILDISEFEGIADKKLEFGSLRNIFDYFPLPVLLVDMNARIVDCNDLALEFTGLSREEIVGKRWDEVAALENDEKILEIVSSVISSARKGGEESVEFEVLIRGDRKSVRVYPRIFRYNGRLTFLIAIEDVTRERKTEIELRNMVEILNLLKMIDSGIISGRDIKCVVKELLRKVKEKISCEFVCLSVFDRFSISIPEGILISPGKGEEIIVENLVEKEELNDSEVELLKNGVRSYCIIPLVVRGRLLGEICIGSKKEIEQKNLDFLRTLSAQLAIAIHEADLFEIRKAACRQIEENIKQFAILVDQIRNPLTVLQIKTEMGIRDENLKRSMLEAIEKIVSIVEKLDKSWLETEKLRRYLKD